MENPAVFTIPLVSAFIGWFTNVVAVKMMFYPTKFIGIPPFLGWQGLVPLNAERLARMSTRLITGKLLSLDDLFAGFQGAAFAKTIDPVIDHITGQIVDEIATKHAPMLWQNAGDVMQAKVRETIRQEVHEVIVRIVDDFRDQIHDILDLEKVVIEAVLRDRRLLSQMFIQVGDKEFKFIEWSGAWLGFPFGILQMLVWVLYPEWWTLPFAGFLVGYITNWVALKLVFDPKEPKRIGPFVLHGLFHKRQREVASAFSRLVAADVLNADNIVTTVQGGESGRRAMAIVEKRVGELVDRYEKHPMASMVLPEGERAKVREEMLTRIREEMPKPGGLLHAFAGKAIDIRNELETRMTKLDPESFEGVLRPAFQADEWKLIVAGAVLGFAAGLFQVVYVFGQPLFGG